jgi:hypothetical protein
MCLLCRCEFSYTVIARSEATKQSRRCDGFFLSLRAVAKQSLCCVKKEIATRPSDARNDTHIRHCEERSDEAISLLLFYEIATAALRQPRNDDFAMTCLQ